MQGFKTLQTVILIYMVQIEYLIHILYVFIFHCTKLEDDTDNPITPITDNITLATDLCRFSGNHVIWVIISVIHLHCIFRYTLNFVSGI